MRLAPAGTFCLEASRALEMVSGSGSDSFYIILKHISITLQCYGFMSTINIYFQLPLTGWEFSLMRIIGSHCLLNTKCKSSGVYTAGRPIWSQRTKFFKRLYLLWVSGGLYCCFASIRPKLIIPKSSLGVEPSYEYLQYWEFCRFS